MLSDPTQGLEIVSDIGSSFNPARGVLVPRVVPARPTAIVTGRLIGLGVLVAMVGQSTSVFHVVGPLIGHGLARDARYAARGRVMATLQAAMSGAGIASMLFAVVLTGGALTLVLYRGVAPGREPTPFDDPMTTERAPA